jgi:hypothetical protein
VTVCVEEMLSIHVQKPEVFVYTLLKTFGSLLILAPGWRDCGVNPWPGDVDKACDPGSLERRGSTLESINVSLRG